MTVTGEVTAGKIVEVGRQLIMRRGYSGFSYSDVADAIDIRKASIHHHFPTKADLAVAVVKRSREVFDSDMAALQASGADAPAQLRAYFGHWESCIADDSAPFCVAGMLGAEMPALPDVVALEVRAHFDDLAAWLKHVLESGVRGKQFKLNASIQTEARKLVSLVYGAMLAARAYGNASLFREVTADVLEKLVKPRKTTKLE